MFSLTIFHIYSAKTQHKLSHKSLRELTSPSRLKIPFPKNSSLMISCLMKMNHMRTEGRTFAPFDDDLARSD